MYGSEQAAGVWGDKRLEHARGRMARYAKQLSHASRTASSRGHPLHAKVLDNMAVAARDEVSRLAKLDSLNGFGGTMFGSDDFGADLSMGDRARLALGGALIGALVGKLTGGKMIRTAAIGAVVTGVVAPGAYSGLVGKIPVAPVRALLGVTV